MTTDEAVAILNAISGDDPERAHNLADQVLYAVASPKVQDAFDAVIGRCSWWSSA